MPTIIDSLLVTLGLKTDEFSAGTGVVGKGLKELEASARSAQKALNDAIRNGADPAALDKLADASNKASANLNKVKNASKGQTKELSGVATSAAKFLAVIGGTMAVKRFIEDTIESSAALGRLSQNLGAGVSTISSWSNAAELAGGSATGLQGTMDMLSRAQTELMLTGQSALIPFFSTLGVAMADASGKARPLDDILLDLADRFGKMDRTTANNMGRMMGIDQGTMNLLLKGRTEVENMIQAQREYNAVSKEQAEESAKMERSIKETQQAFAAFGRELLHKAAPAIMMVLDAFSSLVTWAKANSQFITAFVTVLTVGLVGLAAATTPINLVVLAVAALAAGIAALYTSYQDWQNGAPTLIDWSIWGPGIQSAIKALKWMKDLLGDIIYRTIAAVGVLAALAQGDWQGAKIAAGELISGNGKTYGAEEPAQAQPTVPAVASKGSQATTPATTGQAQPTAPVVAVSQTSLTTGGTRAPKGKDELEETQNHMLGFFQKLGWTAEQSAGIVANMKKESAFNPAAVGDNGRAYGIAQWHPDRQAEFQKQFGKSMRGSTLDEQMAFVNYELTQGKEKAAGDKLRNTTNAGQAAATVSTYYERPAATAKEAYERANMARNIMATGKPTVGTAPSQPAPATATQAAPVQQPAKAVTPSQPAPATATQATPVQSQPAARPEPRQVTLATPFTPVPGQQRPENEQMSSLLQAIAKAITTMMQFMLNQADKKEPAKLGATPAIVGATTLNGIPGASGAAQGAGAATVANTSPAAIQQQQQAAGAATGNTVTTTIGTIEVKTQATDAKGIAQSIGDAMNWQFTAQANNGLA